VAHNRLVAPVVGEGLLGEDAQRVHNGKIVEGEQAGIVTIGQVGVLVDRPGRDDEDVVLVPVEPLAVDDREALALGDVVDEGAGVAVRLWCARPAAATASRPRSSASRGRR
jgi:hypothetical protein